MKKILQNHLACFILGSICLLAALIFAPIWNFWEECPWKTWGLQIVNLLIASILICYLALYLAKKIKKIDKMRAKTRAILSGKNWGECRDYHLTVNTTDWEIKELAKSVSHMAEDWFKIEK